MHASHARHLRHRQFAARRSRHGSPAVKAVVLVIPIVVLVALLGVGLAGATFALAGYAYYAKDLPEPRQAFEAIEFSRQTKVWDRTGKVLLATYGTDRRELVGYGDIPPTLIDATTAIEDKDFWENSGFDPVAFVAAAIDTLEGRPRGGSTITQQLVRVRLLPEKYTDRNVDPYERKVREIIQAIRLTQAYPGPEGKRAIIEVYLNNNNYGNRSYGVAAAARAYWRKDLGDLTLAECALLAGIPKAPTTYDLVRNAVEEPYTDEDGREQVRLVVPQTSSVVQRRNLVLDAMRKEARLTAGEYTAADYEAAKMEPVILAPQVTDRWKAPHFSWKVHDTLGQLLCGSDECELVNTGGFTVISTLDYKMQRITEKWVHAAAIIPNMKDPSGMLKARGIPRSEWPWIRGLRGHNIHNAAAGVMDYRTGEVLAYAGSASYTARRSRRLQPQFDVLGDGWRQPGSAIKPLGYLIGIDDRTMTAATMFMDVVTNFGGRYSPTQADHLERGPVRLRSALQFSLNIPAIKAGFINGLAHQFKRTKDFGLRYPRTAMPVASESIGTLEVHPIDLIGAYGTIANGGVLMPRRIILRVLDADGIQVWPPPAWRPKGTRVVSRGAAYIITDILAGNTQTRVNPFWARWRITNGVTSSKVRPAAYKTGTTSDNRDVHAYGYLAPPSNRKLPALVAGVWLGNSDNSPNDGLLSLDTSGPLWSAILSEVSKGMPIEGFGRVRPKGLVTVTVDAFTGMRPGPSTTKRVSEIFLAGTQPKKVSSFGRTIEVDAASGLPWREGCTGPKVSKTFVDYRSAEHGFKAWQKANAAWQARAARGAGVRGPQGSRTAYFYGAGDGITWYPFGRSWGGKFAPTKKCPIGTPPACVPGDPASPCPSPSPGASPSAP
jgi:membrane peptidoglycan carboxypeptidase